MARTADYVVVGSGSAGAILARRLADSGASVILLEAGRPNRSALVRIPGMLAVMHAVPRIQRRVTWQRLSVPQPHADGRRIPQTHGRVLGGSSSVNALMYVRGNRQNFDDWAAEGASGWGYDDVLAAFRRLETFEDGPSALRGGHGPIHVTRVRDVAPATESFLDALSSVAGAKRNDDYNGAEQDGASITQQNVARGRRQSTAVGFLDDVPGTLELATGCTVRRVVLDSGRAVGVEIQTSAGPELVRAEREVVLSAGAFASPQLLMLSGIGPADHLGSLGIDVVSDLPVGDNLQDHLMVSQTFPMATGRRSTLGGFLGAFARERFSPDSTWLSQSMFEGIGFVRSPHAAALPDLQVIALPYALPASKDARDLAPSRGPALTILSVLLYPESRGTVRLAAADPEVAPLIDPNYLAESRDVDVLVAAQELVTEVMSDASISPDLTDPAGLGRASRAELAQVVRARAASVFHPVGTCRMGIDEGAVVDPLLRVRGVESLRVADASVMPTITGGNTNAPAMMIGERAAQLILEAETAS